jgi:flagellar M-ring protein FliF
MDQLRRILDTIGKSLGKLGATQKLLVGAMAVIVLMALFLVSQYAGAPKMVPVLSGGSSEDQQKVAEYLETQGVTYRTEGGRILVPAEKQYALVAQLQRANALPADKKLLFASLQDNQDWMRSRSQLDQRFTIALANELALTIKNFPGVTDASVVISAPPTTGLGAATRKPTAQVTVFTKAGGNLDQGSVDALADLVAGSVAGLEVGDVKIIHGSTGRRYRAAAPGDFTATTYLEQASKVEERIQNKIVEHLSPFIPNVIVSVNAIVDASRTESRTDSVLPKGEGTQSLLKSESTTTETSTDSSGAAEPGVGANIGLDINRAGAGGRSNSNLETSDTTYENIPGRKVETRIGAQGKPLKINVAVSVPKDYVTQVLAAKTRPAAAGGGNAPAAPSDADVEAAWAAERPKLEAMLKPLIETEVGQAGGAAAGSAAAGNLVVSLIPVDMMLPAGGNSSGNTAGIGSFLGGGGSAGGLLGNSLVKQIALGGLAAMSIGLMLLMVKRAGKAQALPTAEELVGIPPALEPGSDLVGEADETDTAMSGIEVDDEELRVSKMLEQVTDLVKTNPSTAATVFNRWMSPEV